MAPFPRTTLMAHERQPVGRPSTYKPEYCELVMEDMANGYSLTAFAGRIKVSADAIYDWIRAHPEFSDAVNRARTGRVRAGETKLLAAKTGSEAASAIFLLKNACPEEWREVRHQESTLTVRAQTLTDAQLMEIAGRKAPLLEHQATQVEEHVSRDASTDSKDSET